MHFSKMCFQKCISKSAFFNCLKKYILVSGFNFLNMHVKMCIKSFFLLLQTKKYYSFLAQFSFGEEVIGPKFVHPKDDPATALGKPSTKKVKFLWTLSVPPIFSKSAYQQLATMEEKNRVDYHFLGKLYF